MIFHLNTPMHEVELKFPFARSTLHTHFHIGGCQKCGYEPEETIEEVGKKHNKDPATILQTLNTSYEDMNSAEISVAHFSKLLSSSKNILIIDVREEWEYNIANISGSILLSETNFSSLVEKAKACEHVVVVCHHGLRSMNATLYLREHGIIQAKNLTGGIDAYSKECDSSLQRY